MEQKDSRTLYPVQKSRPDKNPLALPALAVGVAAFLPFVLLVLVPQTALFSLLLSLVLSVAGVALSVRSRKVSIHIFSTIGFICAVVVLCITLFIFLLALPLLF